MEHSECFISKNQTINTKDIQNILNYLSVKVRKYNIQEKMSDCGIWIVNDSTTVEVDCYFWRSKHKALFI